MKNYSTPNSVRQAEKVESARLTWGESLARVSDVLTHPLTHLQVVENARVRSGESLFVLPRVSNPDSPSQGVYLVQQVHLTNLFLLALGWFTSPVGSCPTAR